LKKNPKNNIKFILSILYVTGLDLSSSELLRKILGKMWPNTGSLWTHQKLANG